MLEFIFNNQWITTIHDRACSAPVITIDNVNTVCQCVYLLSLDFNQQWPTRDKGYNATPVPPPNCPGSVYLFRKRCLVFPKMSSIEYLNISELYRLEDPKMWLLVFFFRKKYLLLSTVCPSRRLSVRKCQ